MLRRLMGLTLVILLGAACGREASLPASPEGTVRAFTAACQAGDADMAQRLYPPDQIDRSTPDRMKMHGETVSHLCRLLRWAKEKHVETSTDQQGHTVVMVSYDKPPADAKYSAFEAPPMLESWTLVRQGRGWAVVWVAGS